MVPASIVARLRAACVCVPALAVLGTAVRAEGAARVLDCTVARICDAAGVCEAAERRVMFRMEPVETGADGSGRYELSVGSTAYAMDALSASGPFVWAVGESRHTLIASSESEFLWHTLRLGTEPAASVRFLACTFRQ